MKNFEDLNCEELTFEQTIEIDGGLLAVLFPLVAIGLTAYGIGFAIGCKIYDL